MLRTFTQLRAAFLYDNKQLGCDALQLDKLPASCEVLRLEGCNRMKGTVDLSKASNNLVKLFLCKTRLKKVGTAPSTLDV
jgi:hypothetical protein